MTLFNIIFHHGGQFVRESFVFYRGGSETIVSGQDSDTWSYYEAMRLVLKCGYNCSGIRMWRKIEGIDGGFFHITEDVDVTAIVTHSLMHKVDGHIWLEHFVGDNSKKASFPNFVDVGEENDEAGDDETEGVRFGDSEEERLNDDNEGFEVVEVDRPANGNRVEIGSKKFRYKLRANKDTSTISKKDMKKLEQTPQFLHFQYLLPGLDFDLETWILIGRSCPQMGAFHPPNLVTELALPTMDNNYEEGDR